MYKKLTKMIAIVVAVFCCNFLFAQTSGTVKGKVLNDSTGKPLPNASVFVAGTKRGTVTDAQGNFTLKLPDETKQYKLQITYTGFAIKEVTVKAGDNVTVKVKESANEEGEVVVQTGLGGAIKKKELTSSVSTVGAKDLKDVPVNSVAEALNGRLAGVTATTAEGSPDADIKIKVRGGGSITQDNSPLYIVDGVQVENGLNGIVLQDIQDITVLKDAAALSVYGARGANGVIIITTKSGKIGEPKVTYNMFYGIKNLPKTLGVMSPYEFVIYNYERNLPDTSSFVKDFGNFDTFKYYKNAVPVDWQKEVLGKTGFIQMHNIGISGGANKWTYNFSYTYNDDKAIVLNSSYKRHQINFKNEFKISNKIKATLGTRYTNQTVLGAGVSDVNTSYSRLRNAVKSKPFLSPGQAVEDEDPFIDDNNSNNLRLSNPVLLINSEYRRKTTNQYNITASFTYTINKHLTFKSTLGYDKREIWDRRFYDSLSSVTRNESRRNGQNLPIVGLDTSKTYSINNSNILTYSLKNFKKKHDIELIAGEETVELNGDERFNSLKYYPVGISKDDAFNNTNLGEVYAGYPKHNQYKSTQLSFFGIARYSYLKKYFFTFTYRADGSSKFINKNRWGSFTSGSLAWRVSNEKFMDKVKFINDLKLRASYGAVGNNRIADYLFLSTFTNQTYFYGINGQQIPAYSTSELANEKLKWEALVNMNFGFDMTILKNRLDISVDYFRNKSSDLLLRVPIASTFGFASQTQNIGATSSRGVEIQLNAAVIQKKNGLNWNSSFNISFSKNNVEALGEGMKNMQTNSNFSVNGPPADYITQVGQQVGAILGYVYDGFYKTEDFDYNATTMQYSLKKGVVNNAVIGLVQPGSIKFKDLNGDSVIDITNDRTIIGNPNPKFTGGWNNQFSYKNWDLSVFVNFSYGNDIYNANKIDFTNANNVLRTNLIKEMEGRWRTIAEDGTTLQWVAKDGAGKDQSYGLAPSILSTRNVNANMWMPLTSNGSFHSHSWAIEDGSFIRINNVTLGYSLPIKALVKLGISKLRVYATANNLAVFTKYTGYDPEVSVSKNPLTPGLDYSAYPKSRSFLFGLNVTF